MGLQDDLDKKTNKELKEMVSELNSRVKNLENSKTKKNLTSTSETSETSSEVSAFSLDPTKQIGNLKEQFDNAIKGFYDSANIFDDTVFKQLDEYSTQIQSSFGLSKARISEFRSTLAETTPELLKFGYDEADSVILMQDAMKGLGTAASLSSKTLIQLGATSKVTGVDVGELAANFREVGISVQGVGKEMEDVTDYARSVGVSVKGVADKVSDNLKQMNLYNFEGGVQGLAKMAAQSERLGVSMGDTFALAEKLMSPEKAIDMSAALQRLGVTSGALLDPLRAMDLAQNDPEQLQKEMVNLSKEFTTFNEKTGKMEILPGAKRRLREVADELDMDADAFAKMSIQASDFDRKLKQIRMPAIAEGDEATKELIASMAQLDTSGVATIQVKDVETGIVSEKKVEELTPDDIKNLQKANEESSKSIEEIAINQLDETKQINAYLQSGKIAGKMALATAPTVEKLGYFVSESTKSMAKRYREGVGSVAGIREKQEGVAGPIEDYIYGFTQDDQATMNKAKSDFLSGIDNVTQSFFEGTTEYVKNVFNDAITNVSSTFGRQQNTEVVHKHEGTLTLKGEGNVNGVTQRNINDLLSDPSNASQTNFLLNGGSAPSAATGKKN
jgi:hypothetical protein